MSNPSNASVGDEQSVALKLEDLRAAHADHLRALHDKVQIVTAAFAFLLIVVVECIVIAMTSFEWMHLVFGVPLAWGVGAIVAHLLDYRESHTLPELHHRPPGARG